MTTQPTLAKDPVCGMTVDPAKAKATAEHAGQRYYFCCTGCAQQFQSNPEQYMRPKSGLVTIGAPPKPPSPATPAAHKPAAAYVCPMCPEVHESKPGACPSCGMALEPEFPVASTKTEYTCPMHPEITRDQPGSCPICGMALEPRTVTASEEENPELRDMTRRFWISVALTVPLLGAAMADMLPGMPVRSALPN